MGTELASYSVFEGLNWFITQAFFGLLPWPNSFAVVFPIILFLMPLFPRYLLFNVVKIPAWRNRIRLAALPLIGTLMALYGFLFRDKGPDHQSPAILTDLQILPFILFGILSIYQIVHNDKCRIFAVTFVIVNVYYLLIMNNLAFMTITGRWTFEDV